MPPYHRLRDGLTDGDDQELSIALQQCPAMRRPRNYPISTVGRNAWLWRSPKDLDASRCSPAVHKVCGDEPTPIQVRLARVLLRDQVEQLPVDRVSVRFLQSRPDCQELASRLHTRIDVSW